MNAGATVLRIGSKAGLKAWRRRHPLRVEWVKECRPGLDMVLSDANGLDDIRADPRRLRYQDLYALVMSRGGYDYARTIVEVKLWNRSTEIVDVENVRVSKVCEGPAIDELRVHYHSGGGGRSDKIGLLFHLDQDRPTARPAECGGGNIWHEVHEAPDFFSAQHIVVLPGAVQYLVVTGTTASTFCEWKLILDLDIQGTKTSHEISAEPFRTSGQPLQGFLHDLDYQWWNVEGAGLYPRGHRPF